MTNSTIKTVVNEILFDAKQKAGNALIDRASAINSAFDDARGCVAVGKYASALECAAEALRNLDDLLDYADSVMGSADGPSWEFVRDALGTVRIERIPLSDEVVKEYSKRIKRYVSPTFGDHEKQYITTMTGRAVQAESNVVFREALDNGVLISAELYTLGAAYYWDKKLSRWVLDSMINPVVKPWLAKYM